VFSRGTKYYLTERAPVVVAEYCEIALLFLQFIEQCEAGRVRA
jgi:hypothetical protein